MSKHTLWFPILLAILFAALPLRVCAQFNNQEEDDNPFDPSKPKRDYVYLLHADETRFNKNINAYAKVLVGNVSFRHDSLYMYCDSALFYEASNSIDAFGNVRMEQGDTLFLYGDRLMYDGNAMLAKVRNNVRMEDPRMVLTTDSLNYDRTINLGYYLDGGMLQDSVNTLTSVWGEYDTKTKDAEFNYEVTLTNKNYTLTGDTLGYNTNTRIATISGPTNIVSDENRIYSERGFYDTGKDQVMLFDRSTWTNGDQRLVGDSLFYDKNKQYGEAFKNVILDDFKDKTRLTGDYVFYDEVKDSAVATRRAIATEYSQGDSLFLHGDTLKMITYNNETDSLYRILRAYRHVRVYRSDLQAVCDSLVFNTLDSCITMYYDPIVWNGPQQVLGEKIYIYLNDSTVEKAYVENQALLVEKLDTTHYNQIGGRDIKAYFVDGEIEHADVSGNVQVIYYYREEGDSVLLGMNTTEASMLTAYMSKRTVDKLLITHKSNGIFYPLSQAPSDKMKLASFGWFANIRPLSKEDTLIWRGKKEETKLKTTKRNAVPLPSLKGLEP